MASTDITAYLAIPMPSNEFIENDKNENKSRFLLYESIDDLCSASEDLAFRFGEGIVNPEIELLEGDKRSDLSTSQLFSSDILNETEILSLHLSVPTSNYDSALAESERKFSGNEARAIAPFLARKDFQKRVSDLLVMANIARVGSIELRDSALVQDGSDCIGAIPTMNAWALQRAVEIAESMDWPTLRIIDVRKAWSWAERHTPMLEGFDGSNTGRAINAFSRLFDTKTSDEPMQLVWALVGLEAMYCTRPVELLAQVRERSQLLLGKQQSYKKRLSRMYDFRSRFVHGDLDFVGLCLAGDARDEVQKFDNALLDAIAVATAVLAATLQQIVDRNWDGLKFSETVDNAAAI